MSVTSPTEDRSAELAAVGTQTTIPELSGLTGCAAPTSTLYFAPDGAVRACCVNHDYVFGRVGEQTIREVWEGARLQALRDAIDRDDYSLGCQECGSRFDADGRAWSNAPQFDRFAGQAPGRYPQRMDFILSITCNLQCEMCSGEWSSSIRTQREGRPPMKSAYGDEFFDELREFLPHLEQANFLGGEPFLAREQRRVMDLMIETGFDAPITVVTNGTQWNERVARYLRELPISVTVSVDGVTAPTNEALRVGTDHARMRENVDAMHEIVKARGGDFGFHYCLMAQNWHEFGRFLLEADAKDRFALAMTVTTEGFSLFNMPPVELRPIVEALEAENAEIRDRLDRNRAVWDAELERLRNHLAKIEAQDSPVWVPLPTTSEFTRPSALDDIEQQLVAWAGSPALTVDARGGRIEDVDAPEWAARLDPQGWVGLDVAELAPALDAKLGPSETTTDDSRADGIVQSETRFDNGSEQTIIRSASYFHRDGRHDDLVILLAARPG